MNNGMLVILESFQSTVQYTKPKYCTPQQHTGFQSASLKSVAGHSHAIEQFHSKRDHR